MAPPDSAAPAARRRPWVVVAGLAVATFALALMTAAVLLPYGSINRDESTYLEFAEMIADGEVTLPAETHRAFRPWASAVIEDRIVVKYAPPWPGVLAAFGIFGDAARRAAPAAAGAAAVALVFALARRQAGGTTPHGAVAAAALLAFSPLLVVQAATALSYVFQLVLGLAAAVLLLRRRPGAAALAGFVSGVAVFSRPFDALLFIGPFAATVLWRERRLVVAFLLGGLAPAAAFFAYNAAVVGHPLRLPFTVTGPTDAFGFGRRGIFPGATVAFDLADGLTGALATGGWLMAWSFGGPILVVLAVLGYRRLPPSDARRALAAVAIVHPLGYVFFWGASAVVQRWDGAATLGPFYHLPLLVPLAVFGGHGLVRLRFRPWIGGVVAASLLVTGAWLPPKVRRNQEITRTYAAVAAAVRPLEGPAVLIAPRRGVAGYDSWTPFLRNRPDLDQPVLYADERGARDFDLVDQHPERRLVRLVPAPTMDRPIRFRLDDVDLVRAADVAAVHVRLRPPPSGGTMQPYLVAGTREVRQPLGADGRVVWQLVAGGATSGGSGLVLAEGRGVLAVGVEVTAGGSPSRRFEERVPYRVVDGRIELLVAGQGYRRAGRRWVPADVADIVRVVQGT